MLSPKDYLGRGWGFPVRPFGKEATIRFAEYEQDIQESIRIILSTSKGERVMRPDFGCGIHDMVFDVISTTTLADMEDTVRTALAAFEPRIEVHQVKALSGHGVSGQLQIAIDYTVRGTNNQVNLVYPFYLRERG